MKIVLIGFMGSGKSSVARELARKLDLRCIELDELILEKSGCESIIQVFDTRGEESFRELEYRAALGTEHLENVVVSPGAGAVTREQTMRALKKNAIVVYLRTSFEVISSRLKNDIVRPLFRDPKKAQELYEYRAPLYASYADLTVDTDGLDVNQVVSKVIDDI